MKIWLDPQPTAIPDDLRAAVGGHDVIAQSLIRRGMAAPETAQRFLDPAVYVPAAAGDLPDMDQAVDRLRKAVRDRETILVWGDFDVDGQTSTALLVSALRDLGAVVRYHIPNRFTEGHGIHLPTLKTWLDGGIDLLLTCDTGIVAHEAAAYAGKRGIDVIITDHHTLPESLPQALAAVNPMRLPEEHPLRELPGVGTAYQVVKALYGSRSVDHLLDLVAVGIVADVMVQVDDTRYLLQRGLDVLRNSPRPGLRALIERAGINPADLTEMDIGFALAPRLNALGRLADANPAVELLTTADTAIIAEQINELEGLNQKRRLLTRQVYEAARQGIQSDPSLLKYAALVIAGEGWHTGVVGIVASRLAEDYNCPVIVLSQHDGILSGSARSVKGANIVAAIGSQADLIGRYGGHTMAAGLSLNAENLFAFRRGLSQAVRDMLGKSEIQPELAIDAFIDLSEINLDFAEDISRLAPFGNGNPPLILATRNVHLKSRRTLGSRGDHLDLRIADEADNEQRVIWWFGDLDALPAGRFDLAYTVRANVFNGKREALVEWLDARPAEGQFITVDSSLSYQIVDYRQRPRPETLLEAIKADYDDVLIWAEASPAVTGVDRYHLRSAQTLVVWTVPSDVAVWKAALSTVQPDTVILFANVPELKTAQQLIKHVIGLAKYALNHHNGIIHLSDLAALTGQSELTIITCLKWIQQQTQMSFHLQGDDSYRIVMDEAIMKERSGDLNQRLQRLLAESAAYRRYWLEREF